ncbi:MAG: hypothetical protein Q8L45_08005 [Xanthomonadaceae bacterium]|nr:hypothetical protein [Xanthomonadaceae bacterium]MDZ4114623.1 hypothetical protein [Xanthomonadaceae bacterium]MDZ4379525.1 hypothetical protein [Xanthomonadaceae bacterium]
MSGKYDPLHQHLRQLPRQTNEVTLSFADIERIIESRLPKSASDFRAWWGNQVKISNRPQAAAWLGAGFQVEAVHQNYANSWVRFVRSNTDAKR